MSLQPYTYVLVRTDLSPEQQVVQACHAALHAGFAYEAPATVPNLVLLAAKSQKELLAAADLLRANALEFELFFEPDFGVGYSALATKSLYSKEDRAVLSGFPLLRLSSGLARRTAAQS